MSGVFGDWINGHEESRSTGRESSVWGWTWLTDVMEELVGVLF